ncbi:hypothetical protein EVAR_95172_1 [Eumeta japonica]|uniref:Uncharacterized protein n=1 Tax=Eumeta variegata TaxID=151549 RepID=A0A4C1VID6_EUMVA|nr:hypothetical protein EVAR_95172_1 [Eumeta japonica]
MHCSGGSLSPSRFINAILSIRYPVPSQDTGNALVAPLRLGVSTDDATNCKRSQRSLPVTAFGHPSPCPPSPRSCVLAASVPHQKFSTVQN